MDKSIDILCPLCREHEKASRLASARNGCYPRNPNFTRHGENARRTFWTFPFCNGMIEKTKGKAAII